MSDRDVTRRNLLRGAIATGGSSAALRATGIPSPADGRFRRVALEQFSIRAVAFRSPGGLTHHAAKPLAAPKSAYMDSRAARVAALHSAAQPR